MFSLLHRLTQAISPSGYEQTIAKCILEEIKPYADTYRVDALGNVLAFVKGTDPESPSMLLSAHMDEVGFIVKKIEENGLLRFEKIGGHDDRILLAQRVRILGKKGPVPAVIGTISAHFQRFDDTSKVRNYRDLYIDCGVGSKAEVLELGIEVGSPISWATDLERLGPNRIVGKALDDRVGCAVQIQVLERLVKDRPKGDVYFLFSIQEEVGLRGASVAAFDLDPDFALAIDATAVGDTPEPTSDHCLFLGKGPGIKIMDFSFITHPAIKHHLLDVAKERNIPYQLEIFMGIGTDAGALFKTKSGIPTGVISIPSRYAHSPVEMMDLRDIEHTVELLEHAIRELPRIANRSFLEF
jgi:tetrahedral aminopeptidase